MLAIQPWTASADDCGSLAELQDAIAGEIVRTVRYVALRGNGWPEGHKEDRVHEVDMAVELGMASGTVLVLSWAMDGLNEGMAIELRNPEEAATRSFGDPIDVSNHIDWRRFLGMDIASLGVAWHIPNEGCPEMPWAYRIDFSDKSNLVIALGESEGGRPIAYMPDALVVIFDEKLAADYKIPASRTPSSG